MLLLDEEPAFELSWWCCTCQFFFRRLEGANDTLSIPDLRQPLAGRLSGLEQVISRFAALLPAAATSRCC